VQLPSVKHKLQPNNVYVLLLRRQRLSALRQQCTMDPGCRPSLAKSVTCPNRCSSHVHQFVGPVVCISNLSIVNGPDSMCVLLFVTPLGAWVPHNSATTNPHVSAQERVVVV
jgi:hypothetical protein